MSAKCRQSTYYTAILLQLHNPKSNPNTNHDFCPLELKIGTLGNIHTNSGFSAPYFEYRTDRKTNVQKG